ncbi:hypothetical protein [Rhizobium sp. Leaf341]|uniref:hypothetical protein n=1 Tax=Rhizobium sp. Leaf341 TaxID=1736344 RepID=UPI000713D85C|nr:hypothetical protein [Rhizobium sp. Leaf341]KQR75775.1 hypothetical protein ASG03_19085 [Rhizobium sp. Leaf341]
MVGANEQPSALAYRDNCRRDLKSPAVSHSAVRAKTELSRNFALKPMAKVTPEFGNNPFIPGRSPICRAADTTLIFSVVVMGLIAVIATFARASL